MSSSGHRAAPPVMTGACDRLDGIELRERQLAEQIVELAARLREAEAEREALATTAKTVRAMAADLDPERPPAPALPGGAAYQQIMDVLEHEHRPLRIRDQCLALDLPVIPKQKTRLWPPQLLVCAFAVCLFDERGEFFAASFDCREDSVCHTGGEREVNGKVRTSEFATEPNGQSVQVLVEYLVDGIVAEGVAVGGRIRYTGGEQSGAADEACEASPAVCCSVEVGCRLAAAVRQQ